MYGAMFDGLVEDVCDPVRSHLVHPFDFKDATHEQLVRTIMQLTDTVKEQHDRIDELEGELRDTLFEPMRAEVEFDLDALRETLRDIEYKLESVG